MVQFQWLPPDVAPRGTQVNKFEQVSSDHRQISVAVTGAPRSDVFVGEVPTWPFPGDNLPYDLSHDAFDVT